MDALGRLTSVVEDPSGLNYTTSYTYDPLGNLLTVSQGQSCAGAPPANGARPPQGCRYFGYDALSRPIWSVQPEAGTFNYSRDNNGNVTWRQANYAIQTSYGYDALNRLETVSYSNGAPGITYAYDPNVVNGIGRLGSVSIQPW